MIRDLPIYMHVNYLENADLSFEQMAIFCARAGYAGIEWRDRDRSGRMPLDEYLPRVSKAASDAGLQFTFGLRNDTTSPDAAVREQSLAHCQAVLQFAGQAGVPVVNFFAGPVMPDHPIEPGRYDQFGSCIAQPIHWERTVDYLKKACAVAADHGVVLALEMHHGYIHDLADPTARLVEQVDHPNVKVNFDYGNIFLHPNNPGMAHEVETVGPHLGYLHVKNMNRQPNPPVRFATPLRDGQINHFVLMRLLLETGYRGIITIENTMAGDKRPLMYDDLTYLRSVLADVEPLLAEQSVQAD